MQAASGSKYDKALDQTRPAVNDALTKLLQMVVYQATNQLGMRGRHSSGTIPLGGILLSSFERM